MKILVHLPCSSLVHIIYYLDLDGKIYVFAYFREKLSIILSFVSKQKKKSFITWNVFR